MLSGLRALAKSKARYILVGGVAANLHGIARGTKDIDVLIPKDAENAQKILESLGKHLFFGIAKEILPEEVISKPFTIIGDTPRIDLLLRAGKLKFEDAEKGKKVRVIDDIAVPFVSLEDLLKSKETGRPADELVIQELKKLRRE